MAGRPAKPTAQHKVDGTYNSTRHGKRIDGAFQVGKPAKPSTLQGRASEAWDLIVEGTPDSVLCLVDALSLEAASRWFAKWDQWMTNIEESPGGYKEQILAGHAWNQFQTIASKFGLTPADRAKIKAPDGPSEEDPLVSLLKRRAGQN
jgi:hypothetical protein